MYICRFQPECRQFQKNRVKNTTQITPLKLSCIQGSKCELSLLTQDTVCLKGESGKKLQLTAVAAYREGPQLSVFLRCTLWFFLLQCSLNYWRIAPFSSSDYPLYFLFDF